ncbi:MAG TPA: maltotransferase domain-containing protein, partial [Ilumatobacteraceae bacterium]|nr:maltotransferase domain-containing protein [Ilumatobacteraceae bacterium]
MPPRTPTLPNTRPSRVIVEPVRPLVDRGDFPAKASLGEPLTIHADVFTDGHDVVAAALRWRRVTGNGGRSSWQEVVMTGIGNDRFAATVTPSDLGRLEYDVVGWVDHLETWRRDTVK